MISTTAPTHLVHAKSEQLYHRITDKIRRSLKLEAVLDAAAAEIQQFLNVDRVKIYKFHGDGSGQVVAEALRSDRRLPSLQGLNFPADDIPVHIRQLFVEAEVRYIADVQSETIGQNSLYDSETGEVLAENWVYRALSPCHAEYLVTMGVRSSIVIPIFYGDRLWGLLVAHHAEPSTVLVEQLQGVQMVIDQLSVAISHDGLLTKAQEKADRETTLTRISGLLHSLTTIELQTALEEAVAAFQGSGGRLFVKPKLVDDRSRGMVASPILYTCGVQPHTDENAVLQNMEEYSGIQNYFLQSVEKPVERPWTIDDLYQIESLQALQAMFRTTAIRSLLIVPLVIRQQIVGYLSIFRDEIETETLWAGRFNPDARQDYPRQSFEIWRQSKTGQVHPWQAVDLELGQALGNQFSAAIEQYELYQRVQVLNASLENQVQERTVELQHTLKDLQRTQSQLIQTEKMSSLGQLVAGVAHEINNPMNFIHGNLLYINRYVENLLNLLKLYQKHYPETHSEIQSQIEEIDLDFIVTDLPQTVASMKVGTERIRQIVLSLRSFSRLDQAEMKVVNIHEGIDSTLMILQHRFKSKSGTSAIQLIKDYGNLPEVECYAGQLNQVFMNILSNAIDALEDDYQRLPEAIPVEPSMIRIQSELVYPDRVRVTIADNGRGIPDHLQSRIFDPFFTTKSLGKGTGLGLSISYQIIVDKHKGSLQCVSTPGQGTEFIIEIPLRQVQ